MKIVITENRVAKLVAEYIVMTYGELKQLNDKSNRRLIWIKKGEGRMAYPTFELNISGTLYIPESLQKTIGSLFGFEYKREFDDAIMGAFEYLYGIRPERVNIYFD